MAVRLRAHEPEDFDKLYALDHLCFPPGIAYSRRMLAYFLRMPQASCTVAEYEGEIAGFIITEEDPPRGHILTLDVAEAQRRLGIGSRLLSLSEQQLATRGVREIVIETSVRNAAGIAFWQRHGFSTVGILKRYYLRRIDGYQMRKNITLVQ
ncbi:MAG: GNAT family N-acetyltransferase [Candidatus Acidiferrum sp.]|jgi:ribosomal protein S18 acetylase RimI-like enzyme